ncbi:MAG: hypothetical protein J2P37_06955 [Ktedonobacteraceae bacterium]|nr:hypothetical protein [Ktedonobacteraceae bacterium]
MSRKMLVTGIASLLVVCVAVSEIFVFSLFSTKSAFATGAVDSNASSIKLAQADTASTNTTEPRQQAELSTTKNISRAAIVNNDSHCPEHTVTLDLKHSYAIAPGQTLTLGTLDVSCFSLLRLVAANHGPNNVQLILTIVDETNSTLTTELGTEALGAGAPPLTDVFELPGRMLNISAVAGGADKGRNSTIDITLYGHV